MNAYDINCIVGDIRYKNFIFRAHKVAPDAYVLYIEATERDHITGESKVFQGRQFYIPSTMTKDDLVRTCFAAVMAWEEHEAREAFSYRGAAIFDPHFDVDEAADTARRYKGE